MTDTIGKFVPDIPSHWKVVTIQQLLSHTSGIKRKYRLATSCKQN
ncbi:MAG: hypothetical protein IPQ25_10600 [Chitinophagaceae bacterium]|nr:hypothetical protein [Chitinophagaceae bacterium]